MTSIQRRRRPRGRKRQRGAAMTELAITLPVFLLILSGLFYFQRANQFAMQSHRAARYAVWHRANIGEGGYGTLQSSDSLRRLHFASRTTVELREETCSLGDVFGGSSTCNQTGFSGNDDISSSGDDQGLLDMLGFSFETYTMRVTSEWEHRFIGDQGRVGSMAAVHDNYSPRDLPSFGDIAGAVF